MAGSKRILVIDDEPDTRTFFTTLLEDAGHETDTAENGQAAVEKVKRQPFASTNGLSRVVKTEHSVWLDPRTGQTSTLQNRSLGTEVKASAFCFNQLYVSCV